MEQADSNQVLRLKVSAPWATVGIWLEIKNFPQLEEKLVSWLVPTSNERCMGMDNEPSYGGQKREQQCQVSFLYEGNCGPRETVSGDV